MLFIFSAQKHLFPKLNSEIMRVAQPMGHGDRCVTPHRNKWVYAVAHRFSAAPCSVGSTLGSGQRTRPFTQYTPSPNPSIFILILKGRSSSFHISTPFHPDNMANIGGGRRRRGGRGGGGGECCGGGRRRRRQEGAGTVSLPTRRLSKCLCTAPRRQVRPQRLSGGSVHRKTNRVNSCTVSPGEVAGKTHKNAFVWPEEKRPGLPTLFKTHRAKLTEHVHREQEYLLDPKNSSAVRAVSEQRPPPCLMVFSPMFIGGP